MDARVPDDYIIDRDCNGKPYSRAEQVKRCGNAVCPPVAEAWSEQMSLNYVLQKEANLPARPAYEGKDRAIEICLKINKNKE